MWLDVDNLQEVGKLEQYVLESATILVLLSRGYFASTCCRRELYTALDASKPHILVTHEPTPAWLVPRARLPQALVPPAQLTASACIRPAKVHEMDESKGGAPLDAMVAELSLIHI